MPPDSISGDPPDGLTRQELQSGDGCIGCLGVIAIAMLFIFMLVVLLDRQERQQHLERTAKLRQHEPYKVIDRLKIRHGTKSANFRYWSQAVVEGRAEKRYEAYYDSDTIPQIGEWWTLKDVDGRVYLEKRVKE